MVGVTSPSITGLPVTVEPGKGSSRFLTFIIMLIQCLLPRSNHKMVLSELVVCLISLVESFCHVKSYLSRVLD